MGAPRLIHVIRQIGALVVAAVTAAATINAYRPLARNGFASLWSWFIGLVVTEFPLPTLASQLGGLVLTAQRLTRPVRAVSWLVAAFSALGLLNLSRAGRQADAQLTAALDSGLGPDRRTASAGLWRRPAGGGTAKTPGPLRMLRIYRDYAHDGDISYGEYGRANHLDIWRRPDLDLTGTAPVLFQIPGGAWTTGNKRGQAHPLMSHLAELGWICVAINYRHSPRNTWPDHIIDVKRALAWVKAHISEYGGDPDFIAITGGSAGGHLSSLAALTPNDPRFQPGFEEADTRVQAAVPFYGVYDFTRLQDAMHPMMLPLLERMVVKQPRTANMQSYLDASPVTHISADAPPFFVLHGRNDSLVPVQQARGFVDQLRQVSKQPVVYAELPFTQHAFDLLGSAAFLPFPFDSVIAGGASMAYWRQVQPDPSYHVRLSALPYPGTGRDLGALVERLHSTPLDMAKPLWELHLIEGLTGRQFAMYFKAHHCAVDGLGGVNLIKSWLTTDPEAPPGSGKPEPFGDDYDLASVLAAATTKRAVEGVSAVSELAGRLSSMVLGANSSVRAALTTPRTPFNTRVNRHRRLAVQVLKLPRLKAVAHATDCTVNDVILASVGGACRRYLQELGDLPTNTLTASVPVGFERDADTVNAASGFVAPLGTSIEDPVARLTTISASTTRGKAELLAMSPNALQHYSVFGLLPIAVGQKTGALGVIPPLFNFTVSNVVLSKDPLYLSGAKLDVIVPMSFLCDGYGLNVTLVGYTDKVVLGFLGCRDTLPHLQRLAQYTGAAFEELETAALP